jgi:N-acetylglucosaminyldiphosphoundecaprenol N-acetyl-beta-D-mannosaminyltransferase
MAEPANLSGEGKPSVSPFIVPDWVKAKRFEFLQCALDPLTMQETVELIGDSIQARQNLRHVVVNVAKLVNMQRDAELHADVCGSDIINIDGMGVVWGCRLLGHKVPERVSGIDLMDKILAFCAEHNFRPYILGAKPEVLEQAVKNISAKYPALEFAGSQHGYYGWDNEPEIMEQIRATKPDCLFIAITSPHKERIIHRYGEMLQIPFVMGVGGSVDIYAGFTARAPEWMQRCGLEWLYRIYQEPRRMWKRYAVTNSLYGWMLLKAMLGGSKGKKAT